MQIIVYIVQSVATLILEAFSLVPKRDLFLYEKFDAIRPYYGTQCLDVGCGHGDFAKFLHDQSIQVTGLDVVSQCRHREIPTVLFDGTRMPFADKSFDTTIVMFALHHALHQMPLLSEVARITTGHVLIAEDIIENRFDAVLADFHLRTSPWSKGIDAFHAHDEWVEKFGQRGLRLETSLPIPRYKEPIYPVARRVYVLSPLGKPDEVGVAQLS